MDISTLSISEIPKGYLQILDIKIHRGMPISICKLDPLNDRVLPFNAYAAPGLIMATEYPKGVEVKYNGNAMNAFKELGVDSKNEISPFNIIEKLTELGFTAQRETFKGYEGTEHDVFAFTLPGYRVMSNVYTPEKFFKQNNSIIQEYVDGALYASISPAAVRAGYRHGSSDIYYHAKNMVHLARKTRFSQNAKWGVDASKAIGVTSDVWESFSVKFSKKAKDNITFKVDTESEAAASARYINTLGGEARVIDFMNENVIAR